MVIFIVPHFLCLIYHITVLMNSWNWKCQLWLWRSRSFKSPGRLITARTKFMNIFSPTKQSSTSTSTFLDCLLMILCGTWCSSIFYTNQKYTKEKTWIQCLSEVFHFFLCHFQQLKFEFSLVLLYLLFYSWWRQNTDIHHTRFSAQLLSLFDGYPCFYSRDLFNGSFEVYRIWGFYFFPFPSILITCM